MLECRGLSVELGSRPVLQGVDLDLRPGELVAVIGPNGAGKSTLLRCLSGELEPSAGTLHFEGQALSRWPRRELARRRGVLPQGADLGFDFRVLEVVLMGRAPHADGRGARPPTAIALAALEAVGLADQAEQRYLLLSGGQRQRVQLARVLAQVWPDTTTAPSLVLLDEPSASLDIGQLHGVHAAVSRIIAAGGAALLVTHDLNFAARSADRLVLMDQGSIRAEGVPSTVLRRELLGTSYGERLHVDTLLDGYAAVVPEIRD